MALTSPELFVANRDSTGERRGSSPSGKETTGGKSYVETFMAEYSDILLRL